MLEIYLYNNLSDTNIVDKQLMNETKFDCNLHGQLNILSPIVTIEGTELYKFNYAFIPSLRRYYYINDVSMLKLNVYILQLSVDVLKTYSEDIRASYGHITKQAKYNPYDGEYPVGVMCKKEQYNFENPFTREGTIILVTVGDNTNE